MPGNYALKDVIFLWLWAALHSPTCRRIENDWEVAHSTWNEMYSYLLTAVLTHLQFKNFSRRYITKLSYAQHLKLSKEAFDSSSILRGTVVHKYHTHKQGIVTVAVDGEHTELRNGLPRSLAVRGHYSFKLRTGAVNTQVHPHCYEGKQLLIVLVGNALRPTRSEALDLLAVCDIRTRCN